MRITKKAMLAEIKELRDNVEQEKIKLEQKYAIDKARLAGHSKALDTMETSLNMVTQGEEQE